MLEQTDLLGPLALLAALLYALQEGVDQLFGPGSAIGI
jgi:hypothetical protein